MKKYSVFLLFVLFIALVGNTACSSSAYIKIADTEYVDLSITLLPASILENNLKKMTSNSGMTSVFQEKELYKSLAAQQIIVQKLELVGFCGLKLKCSIPRNHSLLKKLISHDAAKKTVSVRVSQHTVQELLGLIPEENRDFIDVLMAPIITGEKISTEEYRETIAVIYGPKMSAELDRSIFTLLLESPYQVDTYSVEPVGNITVQKQNSACVNIAIPLIDLLCMTDTLTINVQGR